MADGSMTITTYQRGNAEIVVYRPTLTKEEEEKRNRRIVTALEQYGRAVFRNERRRGKKSEPA